MAIETTPKDITPIKRKGIEIAVRGLAKTYPFVIGYKDDTSDQYQSSHYIDLIIDLNKLSEYMNTPINPYWEEFVANNPQHGMLYSIWSYLQFPPEENYDQNIANHPGYILQQKIKKRLETLYTYLPEDSILTYTTDSEWSGTYQVLLKINGFIMRG